MTLASNIFNEEPSGKARIMQEALRLFAEKGLSATSIRDIAAASGFSNPALYKHFKSKDALALTLFTRAYESHVGHLIKVTDQEGTYEGKFKAFVKGYLQAYDLHPNAMMFATDNLPTLWPQMPAEMKKHTAISQLRQILLLGRAQGDVCADKDINLQLSMVIGTLVQLTRQLFLGTLKGPALKHLDATTGLLKNGLR